MFLGQNAFRKAALDRLSSPEQLDMLMQVTKPSAWILLAVLVALVGGALFWGIFGVLPTKVDAEGILISPGGIFDVFAPGSGQLLALEVAEGDLVEPDQVVARIDQPDLDRQIQMAKAQLKDLQAQHSQLASYTQEDSRLRDDTAVMQRALLEDGIRFGEERLAALAEQIANEEQLLQQGLITKQTVMQSKQAYFSTKDQIERNRGELKQLSMTRLSGEAQSSQQMTSSQLSISEAERSLRRLEDQHALLSLVRSPYRGRVVELKAKRGDILRGGGTVMSIQIAGHEAGSLQALVFVPPTSGKNVRVGMEARVSPSTAKKEEYGFLVAKVTYVSEFPSTFEGMMRVLGNDRLVQTLSKEGPPFAVYAELLPDAESASGFRWSSSKGRELKVAAGTICKATVTVRRQRPISLVIPLIREYTGI